MMVIKLGGSLLVGKSLTSCLEKIDQKQHTPIIIVPGGGKFADLVRSLQQQWQFNDLAAHHMALLAMQQMAVFLRALRPEWPVLSSVSGLLKSSHSVRIWSPEPVELDNAGIAASWYITSDSLAAWLAKQVGATELILVKSASIDRRASLLELQNQGVIDSGFHTFLESAEFNVRIQHYHQF